MAELDDSGRKLTVKLVYYGPALSGKTTNLMRLHDQLNPQLRGEMMVLETKNDRTLFFDLLPLGFRAASGLLIKVKLYTVPGQVVHDSTRKAILSRADGVVFVADSRRSCGVNNAESFQNLADNASRVGLAFDALPLAVQFNKRDLPDTFSEDEILARWQATPWPVTFASALMGTGVMDTFTRLLLRVHGALEPKCRLNAEHGIGAEAFIKAITTDHGQTETV